MAGRNKTGVQDQAVPAGPEPRGGDPTSYIKGILRTAAPANGWQVLITDDDHCYQYVLPGNPAKGIKVYWAASGGVCSWRAKT